MTSFSSDGTATGEPFQLSLLQGFPAGRPVSPSGPALAPSLPVARVLIESSLPHLDRPFDYSVPAAIDAAAQPGVRVKVKFNGQELGGYILDRLAESDAGHTLVPLHKVVSPVRVLTPDLAELAGKVAARYAGTISDVLRVAIPPRVAGLEKELVAAGTLGLNRGTAAEPAADPGPEADRIPPAPGHWSRYINGVAFLQHLAAGESPRAVLSALQGFGPAGWPALVAEAVAAARASGRGAVVVVPDYRDLDRVEEALAELLPREDIARLTADDGPTPRYRSYLRVLTGSAGVAVGTRSAAYAPVHNLGLVVCWDDGDDLHIEQRAPYAHTREVLLLRAEQEGAACLMAAHTRSTELQRLVEAGWARPVHADRPEVRRTVPRVVNTADSFEQERDPWPGSRGCPVQPGVPPRRAWNADPFWSKWPVPAMRRHWFVIPAGSRPGAQPAADPWLLPVPPAARQCRSAAGVPLPRRTGAAATARAPGCAAPLPACCGPRRNWAGHFPASRSSLRPGTTSKPLSRTRTPWWSPRWERNLWRPAAMPPQFSWMETRSSAAKTSARGRTPSGAGSMPRRWSGLPARAASSLSPPMTQPGSARCCAGTQGVRAA